LSALDQPLTAAPGWDREKVADYGARLILGFLFLLLSIDILDDFMRSQRMTGLLLLVSEGLVVVLTIVRRRARTVDRTFAARAVTALAVIGPMLVRSTDAGGFLPDGVTAAMLAVGLLVVISGKMVLGRSFGIAPANRGIVARGPYLFVRHPIYTGYLISHVGYIAAHPTIRNVTLLVVADVALVIRALYEERILVQDKQYREYCSRVAWHLVPGVF
jgi:protein-S-isoprenylcysteine O-methyltransferase Ste14